MSKHTPNFCFLPIPKVFWPFIKNWENFLERRKKNILKNQQKFSKLISTWVETFYEKENFDAANFFYENNIAKDPLVFAKIFQNFFPT